MTEDANAFLGNSLPIREGLLAAEGRLPQRFHANRGANGIDGNLSTFLGLAAQDDDREYWGFFGDLTTLYDLSAPSILSQMQNVKLRLVVINNGGGKIFRLLPNWKGLSSDHAQVVENAHDFHFSAWAQAWNMGYVRIDASSPVGTFEKRSLVIEVQPDQAQTDAFWQAWSAS